MDFRAFLRLHEATGPSLTPRDIFNFYFLAVIFQEGQIGSYGKSLLPGLLNRLKEKYLRNLVPLVQEQLYKYHKRGRLDPGAYDPEMVRTGQASDLDTYMRATYRSDMRQRNTVWESLTGHIKMLAMADTPQDIIHAIDRVNNDVHNTGQLTLTKLPGGSALAAAFDRAHTASMVQLRGLADPDLRDLTY